jgi:transcriptional regulator with XRE-family HTH domain
LEELKRLREEKGWSQTRLAQESGVDRATINQVEGGRRSPTIATLELLASALGAEVADFFPKVQAPLPLDAPEGGERTPQEFERALAYVMEPVVAETLKEEQAANRFLSSEGENQDRIVDPPEAEVGRRFLEELSPEERPLAFAEVALGRARFARRNAALEQETADLRKRLRKLLRERDQKITGLGEENAQLREEHEQAEVEKT